MASTNNELVSMAQQFTGLPMDSLIGGPLKAAADANAVMAFTQTKFMLDTCFYQTGTSPTQYTPIIIDMTLQRGVIQAGANPGDSPIIDNVNTTFRLPLLTIIPLNSLAVDNVNVTFEMEVQSSFVEEQSNETVEQINASSEFSAKAGWGPFSVEIKGSASYDRTDSSTHSTHYEKSNSAKYTVLVHAGQLPLPQGVNTIIQAYTNSITPIQLDPPAPTTP